MMAASKAFTFRMESTSWKSQDLIYEEPDRRLVVYVELSGVPEFDWVGTHTEFQNWTLPVGEPISPEKRREILDRLAEWGKSHKVRIDISPAISREEMYADYEKKGWSVERRADGSTLVSPPKREGLLERIARLFR